eukprot:TRINITY_DN2266_c0_g1_i1.p1 TRINITY_DN2266_c0_g1~~TRINITY_DN2266_c0_g1_i1.p1  ORF type:complete len:171 (+),score=14.52 TRINITY_DN2266_c0_g1_i1:103-615(+)
MWGFRERQQDYTRRQIKAHPRCLGNLVPYLATLNTTSNEIITLHRILNRTPREISCTDILFWIGFPRQNDITLDFWQTKMEDNMSNIDTHNLANLVRKVFQLDLSAATLESPNQVCVFVPFKFQAITLFLQHREEIIDALIRFLTAPHRVESANIRENENVETGINSIVS